MAIIGLECLREAVLEEYQRKSLPGQYVIINRNGQACRVSAKQALKITKSEDWPCHIKICQTAGKTG